MAAIYGWNGKQLLRANNDMMALVHAAFLEVIKKEKLKLSKNNEALVAALKKGQTGVGFNVAEYIKTKQQMSDFLELLKKATYQYFKMAPGLTIEAKGLLWNFYNDLVQCGAKLSE